MRDLTMPELQDIQEKVTPEYLKNCAAAYAMVLTYMPSLLSMAKKYLNFSSMERIKSGYSVILKEDLWGIVGPYQFEVFLGSGDTSKMLCENIVNRLNGLL